MKLYRYRSVDWSPGARLERPLNQAKLGIITTAGLHLPDQPPFDESVKGGDCTFRQIPVGVDVQTLRIAHRSSAFDREGLHQDRNLVFPLDRFRDLVKRGEAGGLNHRHFSFMGPITAPRRLIAETPLPSLASFAKIARTRSHLTPLQSVRGTDRWYHREGRHPHRVPFVASRGF